MRTLPAALLAEIAKDAFFPAHLIKLVATATQRWTDCDQDIYFDGHWWTASGIVFSEITYATDQSVATVTLTIPNVDRVFSDLQLSDELRGRALTIYETKLDNNLSVIGCTHESDLPIIIDGYVESLPRSDQEKAQLTVQSQGMTGNIMLPRRVYETKCPWISIGGFKGTYCGYAGAEAWCDGSWARCVALSNYLHFGGWEYISALQDSAPYWGQRVKNWQNKK